VAIGARSRACSENGKKEGNVGTTPIRGVVRHDHAQTAMGPKRCVGEKKLFGGGRESRKYRPSQRWEGNLRKLCRLSATKMRLARQRDRYWHQGEDGWGEAVVRESSEKRRRNEERQGRLETSTRSMGRLIKPFGALKKGEGEH